MNNNSTQETPNSTLYERIGGRHALLAAVEIFYQRVLNDPIINHFFIDLDMKKQKAKMFGFLSMVLGGEVQYTGKQMKEAHQHLKLQESHFNAVIGHLEMTLESMDIDKDLIEEVVDIALSVKSDILYYDDSKTKQIMQDKSKEIALENDTICHQLLQAAADGVVIIDETKKVLFWNTAAEKLWGYTAMETIGKPINYFVPIEHQSAHDSYIDRNLHTGQNKIIGIGREEVLQKKDGSKIPIMLTMTRMAQGSKTYYMAFIKDISKEKQKDHQLQILESAADGIVTINAKTKLITFFNKSAEKILGYNQEEVLGKNVNSIVPLDIQHEHDNYIDRNSQAGVNKIVGVGRDLELERKDGSKLWVNLSIVKSHINEELVYTAFVKDIAEHKKAMADMRDFKATIDTSFARIEFDNKGNILDVNQNFVKALGYNNPEDIISRHHSIFIESHLRDTPEYKRFWRDLENGIVQDGHFKRVSKTGEIVWIQAAYTPVKDENGKIERIIKIAIDITAQKKIELNMQGLQKTVDASFARIEFDSKGNIVDANENFVKTMGYYSIDEIKGKHHALFVENAYKMSRDYQSFWADLENGIAQKGEFMRLARQGNEIWLQAVYTPLKDENGKVQKVIKIAIDITLQKQMLVEVSRVAGEMAKGNLTEKIVLNNAQGDIKNLGDALNTAIQNINVLLLQISQVSNLVAASAEEMLAKGEEMKKTTQEVASATQQMAEGTQQQAQQTDNASKLIEDVLKSAENMAKKAATINKAAEQGQKNSTDGLATIKLVAENMDEIQKSASTTSGTIETLSERSEEIASALNVITDIAAQTNLLALNAAIEAARAGDAGRGFAVVAEEIRKLAEGSRKSAIEIEKVIKEVHKDIHAATKAIQTMELSVKTGTTASKEAESVFANIEKASGDTLDLSKDIVEATKEQKDAINTTAKNIEKIVVVAEETAAGTEQIASSGKTLSQGMNEVTATSEDLANVANQLQESISKFKLK